MPTANESLGNGIEWEGSAIRREKDSRGLVGEEGSMKEPLSNVVRVK